MHQRIDKLRKRIQQFELDAILITSLVNIRYLFGFTGSNAMGLITSDLCFFVTDRRYRHQASEQVQDAEFLVCEQDLIAEFKKINVLSPGARLAFEAMHLTVKQYTHLKKTFPEVKLIASEHVVERISSIKESNEISNIRKAATICGNVFNEILPLIRPGIRELDISAELSYRTKLHGSEKDPFEPIVASGARSALPHGLSTEKEIQIGDLVIIDFGAVTNGYAADFTRTVIVGQPSKKQKEIATVVLEALQLAEKEAKAGINAKDLDKITRDYFESRGYRNAFNHSLGHGIGLEVHGLPRIGEKSKDVLQPGNAIALEPGIYILSLGGVRIEDDFVVTEYGVENLTPFPREPVSVG